MPFKKMLAKLPPRQWSLVGYPGDGKSTFATAMHSPMLVVDADHRFAEVMRLVAGDTLQLSDEQADNVDPERIAQLLHENMPGSGIRTIIIDSLTAIISPLITAAIMDNDVGTNRNKIATFKTKALTMRLLQDAITNTGCDVLWIYHLRRGRDAKAQEVESTSISAVELARLRRSLNAQLRIVVDGNRRGIAIDWSRTGRTGLTLWDETGTWRGMPERIEEAVYGGLTAEDMQKAAAATPTSFASADAAIAWGWESGAFRDAVHAKNAYEKLKQDQHPQSAQAMWALWIAEVEERLHAPGE